MNWNTIPVRVPLTYLRVTVHRIKDLLAIMATRPLSTTLRQLHVKLRSHGRNLTVSVSEMKLAFSMSSLHTFTFVKSFHWQFEDEWTVLDALTSSAVMPVLQWAKLIVTIDVSDLNRIGRSELFNDHRRIDVQYAFIHKCVSLHSDLDQRIPRGSRSHARSVSSATFVRVTSNDNPQHGLPEKPSVSCSVETSFSQTHSRQTSSNISHLCFRRATISLIDLTCGILCHGPSMNSFNYVFEARRSLN